jgi:hypothetical protein
LTSTPLTIVMCITHQHSNYSKSGQMYMFEHRRSRVGRSDELAQSGYGAPSSVFSILAGIAVFVLLTRAGVRHIQKNKPVLGPHRVSVDA